jgi:hypothetical protein
MKYNKLIRDKIVEMIKEKGQPVVFHLATNEEYGEKLKEKLMEEVKEFYESESIEEMADILEVIEAINKFKNFDDAEIMRVKDEKAERRGKFEKRIILDES